LNTILHYTVNIGASVLNVNTDMHEINNRKLTLPTTIV